MNLRKTLTLLTSTFVITSFSYGTTFITNHSTEAQAATNLHLKKNQ